MPVSGPHSISVNSQGNFKKVVEDFIEMSNAEARRDIMNVHGLADVTPAGKTYIKNVKLSGLAANYERLGAKGS